MEMRGRRPPPCPRHAALSSRTVFGGAVGVASALLSALATLAVEDEHLFIGNLPFIGVTVVGLLLGWLAAAFAFVMALLTLIAVATFEGSGGRQLGDLLGLASFLIAGPALVILLRRADWHRATALAARAAAEEARTLASDERTGLAVARPDVDDALPGAGRGRGRR